MQYMFTGYEYYNALIFSYPRQNQKQWYSKIRNENIRFELRYDLWFIVIDIIISYIDVFFSSNKGI